jgi:hypothetical protein
MKTPTPAVLQSCKLMCLLVNIMPKKKERFVAKKLVPKDSKGFYNKAKTAIMTSSTGFIKLTSECEKDNIPGDREKKIREILDSTTFSQENIVKENALV